jgi:hypothetical protein
MTDKQPQIRENHFLYVSDDMLDYLEPKAYASLAEFVGVYNRLYEDARKMLSLLLGGIALCIGFLMSFLTQGNITPVFWSVTFAGVWLMACCLVLMHRCIAAKKVQVVYMPPADLYTTKAKEQFISVHDLRAYNLHTIHQKCSTQVQTNKERSRWLDRVRYGAAATLIVALLPLLAYLCVPGAS